MIRGLNTTNESKRRIVENFQVAVQNQIVSVLRSEKLLSQLSQFESKLTSAGNVTYAAAKSGHDDLVMATLIAYDSIGSGTYSVA
jgi:transcription initiation factor TFIID subunit TAF12